jgi:hypothetical protein
LSIATQSRWGGKTGDGGNEINSASEVKGGEFKIDARKKRFAQKFICKPQL